MDTIAYITRQDIESFPFPHKLWIAINLEFCDCLRWNRDGTVILLDVVSLEDYLNSSRSIFKIKNRSVFLEHLEEFKFERLNAKPEAGEDLVLQYKNENFQRHRLDLLAKMRRHTYQLLGETKVDKSDQSGTSDSSVIIKSASEQTLEDNNRVSQRMLGDACFTFHGYVSNIHNSRLRLQTILNFQRETRLLEKKLKASAKYNAIQQIQKSEPSARSVTSCGPSIAEEDYVIELPADLFENPHDSVLHLDEDFRPDYAGYYGNCSNETVMNFFGDYLPMYEDGSMKVKKVIADKNSTNKADLSAFTDAHNEHSYNPNNANNLNTILTSTPLSEYSKINLNFSSGLEPIFKTEEEQENIDPETVYKSKPHNYNMNNETEIIMDEFLKFKDSSNKSFSNVKEIIKQEYYDVQPTHNNESFENTSTIMKNEEYENFENQQKAMTNQIPLNSVKMEIDEYADETEGNLRSFFSEYKASLDLLYSKN